MSNRFRALLRLVWGRITPAAPVAISDLGQEGEQRVSDLLRDRGYTICEQNFSSHFGEIDIIARRESQLVFVEVKSRKNILFANPQEWVDIRKQKRIVKTARYYLMCRNISLEKRQMRFDVASVVDDGVEATIEYFENAFGE